MQTSLPQTSVSSTTAIYPANSVQGTIKNRIGSGQIENQRVNKYKQHVSLISQSGRNAINIPNHIRDDKAHGQDSRHGDKQEAPRSLPHISSVKNVRDDTVGTASISSKHQNQQYSRQNYQASGLNNQK